MSEIPIFKFAIREDLKDTGDLFLPKRAEPFATGWDVRAAPANRKSIKVKIGEYVKIPLGFRTFCPKGWWFELKPRSSTFAKKKLHCLYGTIDASFEGELALSAQFIEKMRISKCNNLPLNSPSKKRMYSADIHIEEDSKEELEIDFGEAIGQIIPVRLQEMITESITNEEFEKICKERGYERGAGSFGSTSK